MGVVHFLSADSDYKVIAFDGMTVVNKVDIMKMKLKSAWSLHQHM